MYLYYALIAGLIMLFINLIRIQLYKFAKVELLEQRAKLDLVESLVYLIFVIMLAITMDLVATSVPGSALETTDPGLVEEKAKLTIDEAYKLLRNTEVSTDINMARLILQSLNQLMVQIRTYAINEYDQLINRFAGYDFGLAGISYRAVQQLVEQLTGEMDRVAKALVALTYIIRATITLNVLFSAALEALNYLQHMGPMLLMTGILLRAFHWTAGVGAALISFSFSFYVLFPFTLGIFLHGVSVNVPQPSERISLMVDESATYQATDALAELQQIDYSRITEIQTFVNVLYSKAMMGLVVATGLGLGMAMYLYSFLSKGSIVWGAPAGLLRLL